MWLKYNILGLIFIISVSSIFAQSKSEWLPIGLTASGKNIKSGVEAFYQLNKCNKEHVVFIKFINHNSNSIILQWYDAVFTKDFKWAKNKKADIKKSLIINGNETKSGDCSGKSQKELVVSIKDFVNNVDDFNLFGIKSFTVSNEIK